MNKYSTGSRVAEARQCWRKRVFSTLIEAEAAVTERKPVAYKCQFCPGFHLSSRQLRAPELALRASNS